MGFCVNCGHQLYPNAKFCSKCGMKVSNIQSGASRETVFEGKIHKCPNCGGGMKSFEANCPLCGYEVRDSLGVSSVKQLETKLEQIEAQRPPEKDTKNIFQLYGTMLQVSKTDEQKINLIRNFTIPNAKEDIFEFIVLAASNIDMKVYGLSAGDYQTANPARRELSDAWLSKLEQAYKKAEILFKQSEEFQFIQSIYDDKMNEISKQKNHHRKYILGLLGAIIILFGILIAVPILIFLFA